MAAASACDDVQRRAAARPQIIDVGDDDESDCDFDDLDPEEEDELNNIVLLASEAGASSLTLSTDGDSILGMPSAFESKDEANKMSLFEMVVANSALQFEPAMLRPNQYPANHGGKPAERIKDELHISTLLLKLHRETLVTPDQRRAKNLSMSENTRLMVVTCYFKHLRNGKGKMEASGEAAFNFYKTEGSAKSAQSSYRAMIIRKWGGSKRF